MTYTGSEKSLVQAAFYLRLTLFGYHRIFDYLLADEQFPLVFKICVAEHGDPSTRYKKFGYDNEEQFFTGQSKLNKSVRGWLGHSEQNDYDLEGRCKVEISLNFIILLLQKFKALQM